MRKFTGSLSLYLQVTQGDGEIDYVVIGLSHPDNSARTSRQPSVTHISHSCFAIGKGMGRANLGVKILGRVEFVIQGVRPSLLQSSRLFGAQ
jgi:hypothetical protein